MGDYTRTTQELSFGRLRPEIHAAVEGHIEERELGDIESTLLFCCETENKKRKRGPLGKLPRSPDPDPVHYTAAIVTPDWLIWARSGEKSGTSVVSMRLAEIEVHDYRYGDLIADSGVSVFGFIGRAPRKSELFIGLGEESAAVEFRRILEEAVERASTA